MMLWNPLGQDPGLICFWRSSIWHRMLRRHSMNVCWTDLVPDSHGSGHTFRSDPCQQVSFFSLYSPWSYDGVKRNRAWSLGLRWLTTSFQNIVPVLSTTKGDQPSGLLRAWAKYLNCVSSSCLAIDGWFPVAPFMCSVGSCAFWPRRRIDVSWLHIPSTGHPEPFRSSTGHWQKPFRDYAWAREVVVDILFLWLFPLTPFSLCLLADRKWGDGGSPRELPRAAQEGDMYSLWVWIATPLITPKDALESSKEVTPVPSWLSHTNAHAHMRTDTHTHTFLILWQPCY